MFHVTDSYISNMLFTKKKLFHPQPNNHINYSLAHLRLNGLPNRTDVNHILLVNGVYLGRWRFLGNLCKEGLLVACTGPIAEHQVDSLVHSSFERPQFRRESLAVSTAATDNGCWFLGNWGGECHLARQIRTKDCSEKPLACQIQLLSLASSCGHLNWLLASGLANGNTKRKLILYWMAIEIVIEMNWDLLERVICHDSIIWSLHEKCHAR